MESGSVMHVHAMSVCNDKLVAVTGAWTGQLHQQGDDQRWQVAYDYPAGSASFSRLVSVTEFEDNCVVGASARGNVDAKLFSVNDTQRNVLPGWPTSDRVDSIVSHNGELFAFVDSGNKRTLLQYDGVKTHSITLPVTHHPRALYSDGSHLWLATRNYGDKLNRGQLWRYTDEFTFDPVQTFEHVPIALTNYKGAIAIGTYDGSGGSLWMYGEPDSSLSQLPPAKLLPALHESAELDESQVQSLYDELFDLLMDPESTNDRARSIRQQLGAHPQLKAPEFGEAVTKLLSLSIDGEPTTMFNNQTISRQDLIRWYLLTALAINGHGRVDPSWFNSEEELKTPSSGKLFNPSIAAIIASGWLKQNDRTTIAALVQRLNNGSDPLWVKADVVGALTALTNQRLGYNIDAWNSWWEEQK